MSAAAERQRTAVGDEDLLGDEIETGHQLGDRVLDLDAGVHLEEEQLVALDEELDGAGVGVADRSGQPARRLGQRRTQGVGQVRCRRLLDQLLVAALDRAVAVADDDEAAVVVGDDLHLDVARTGEEALDVHLGPAERRLRLAPGGGQQVVDRGGSVDHSHARYRRRRAPP